MIFLQLFWEFLKTGLFAVGGGLATLPFLKAITHKYPWFTANDLMDMIAVSVLPSLTVCLVWIVNLSVYCKEAMRYSKVGSKIS